MRWKKPKLYFSISNTFIIFIHYFYVAGLKWAYLTVKKFSVKINFFWIVINIMTKIHCKRRITFKSFDVILLGRFERLGCWIRIWTNFNRNILPNNRLCRKYNLLFSPNPDIYIVEQEIFLKILQQFETSL